MLRAGVEIHEHQPTIYHCMVMVIDGLWMSVGSTYFDSRSFSVNDEANLNIHDAAFAQEQIAIFEDGLKQSRQITFAEWDNRPASDKVLDALAGTLSAQLQRRALAPDHCEGAQMLRPACCAELSMSTRGWACPAGAGDRQQLRHPGPLRRQRPVRRHAARRQRQHGAGLPGGQCVASRPGARAGRRRGRCHPAGRGSDQPGNRSAASGAPCPTRPTAPVP